MDSKAAHASMRPRRNAAEYVHIVHFVLSLIPASMRPRRNAAEYIIGKIKVKHIPLSFNEAAA